MDRTVGIGRVRTPIQVATTFGEAFTGARF